jgi:hypothetical protein
MTDHPHVGMIQAMETDNRPGWRPLHAHEGRLADGFPRSLSHQFVSYLYYLPLGIQVDDLLWHAATASRDQSS